jgi:hypothetical protein
MPAGGFSRIVASSADMTPEEFAAAEAEEGQTTTVSIDRSGLLGVHHTPEERLEDQSHKSRWTPMVDELRSQIKIRGALSVSDWMFQCLQNQQHGYYTSRHASSVIGGKPQSAATAAAAAAAADGPTTGASQTDVGGDFITSPELGQIFGEVRHPQDDLHHRGSTTHGNADQKLILGVMRETHMFLLFFSNVCLVVRFETVVQMIGVWVLQIWEKVSTLTHAISVVCSPRADSLRQRCVDIDADANPTCCSLCLLLLLCSCRSVGQALQVSVARARTGQGDTYAGCAQGQLQWMRTFARCRHGMACGTTRSRSHCRCISHSVLLCLLLCL